MPTRRQFDEEAFRSICNAANTAGSITFIFPSAKAATYFRGQFYAWRKLQQDLNLTSPADHLIVRCSGPEVTVSRSLDVMLRQALASAGISVEHIEGPLVQEPSPLLEPDPEVRNIASLLYGPKEEKK